MRWAAGLLLWMMVIPTFGQTCEGLVADLDADGGVTFSDFFMLADQFGEKSEVSQKDSLGGEPLNLKIGFSIGNYGGSVGDQRNYVMNGDGSNLLKIAGKLSSVSPDGSKLTFSTRPAGQAVGSESYIVNFDGSNPAKVADSLVNVVWSPEGSKFAQFYFGQRPVQIVSRDGSRVVDLYTTQQDETNYTVPVWSPDGTKLFQVRYITGGVCSNGIYDLTNMDSPVRVYNESLGESLGGRIWSPISWSPDGQHLVFGNGSIHEEPTGLYTIDSDGANKNALSSVVEAVEAAKSGNLVWAENGRIYFCNKPSSPFRGKTFSVKDDGTDFTTHWNPEDKAVTGGAYIVPQARDYVAGQLSPDATHIVFAASFPVQQSESGTQQPVRFFVQDINSSDETIVMEYIYPAEIGPPDFQYSWSPSKRNIAISVHSGSGGDSGETSVIASVDGKESIDLTKRVALLGILATNERIQSVSFHWYTPQTMKADLNQDGTVNFSDFFMLADQFGMTCAGTSHIGPKTSVKAFYLAVGRSSGEYDQSQSGTCRRG